MSQTSVKSEEKAQPKRFVTIYYMGKKYQVPEGITILKALEYLGYRLIRGVGCRGGFCGACTTIYRIAGDYRIYVGLACQTPVQDGMYLVQIPFVPSEKPRYNIEEMKPDVNTVLSIFPEIARCIGCNACTKVCPQEIKVMDAIQTILRGDIKTAARMVFDCISCGSCTLRCPAEIQHFHVFQLVRRLYGKYLAPKAKHLRERIKEIEEGKYEKDFKKLIAGGPELWKKLAEKVRKGEFITVDWE